MFDDMDYDLHGIVGVRVAAREPADVAAVRAQLGDLRAPLRRDPDIVVSFIKPRGAAPELRYIDMDDAAFDDDSFFLLRGRAAGQRKCRIDFGEVGGPCRIVCESGIGSVPLLIATINMVALSKGVLPVHASAFTYDGCGVMVTGWAKGGKTETLLAFMAQGATYVGDEWIYVTGDGTRLHGIPEPIKIWDWHLPELPQYRARLAPAQRAWLGTTTASQRAAERLGRLDGRGSGLLERVSTKLQRQRYVHVTPEKLFGAAACAREGRLDKLVFVVSREAPDVAVQPVAGADVARRMAFSLQYERQRLLGSYLQFRFAFPERRSEIVDAAAERERELLLEHFSDLEACVVMHRFPPSIPSLFDALRPLAA